MGFYVDRLQHKEIARRIGGTEAGSRMKLMRATRALDQKLRELL